MSLEQLIVSGAVNAPNMPPSQTGHRARMDRRPGGGLQWSDASIGGPGSAERCTGIRQKTASPCDATVVIECEQNSAILAHLF